MGQKKFIDGFKKPMINEPDMVKILPIEERYIKYGSDNSFYNMAAAMQIFGSVDVDLLNKSIGYLIKYHDVFRATVVEKEDGYYHKFLSEYPYEIEVIDAVGETKEERFADAYKKAYVFNEIQMNIFEDVLWRMKLYKIDDDEYIFFITMHHTIMDGVTEVIAIMTISQYYDMLKKGITPPPPTTYSFQKFIQTEYEYAETEEGRKHLEYYDKLMEGYEIPDIAPFGGTTDVNISEKPFLINNDSLERFFKVYKTSKFNAFLLCYEIGIRKILNSDDISVGIGSANRMSKELRTTIGHVSRVLPARLNDSFEKSLAELISSMNDNINETMKHQKISPYNEYPFAVSYSSGISGNDNKDPVFLGHKAKSLSFANKRDVKTLYVISYDKKLGILSLLIGDSKLFDPVKLDTCTMFTKQALYQLLNDNSTKAVELMSSPMLIDTNIKKSAEKQTLKLDMRTCESSFADILSGCTIGIERCDGKETDVSDVCVSLVMNGEDAAIDITNADKLSDGFHDIYAEKNGKKWLIDSILVS